MKDNIILIGMPGVGKSTVGVILAKQLGYSFVDCDLVIQEQQDRLLSDIIETEGIDGFLAVENRVCASITAKRSVIATGGSAVYGKEAMAHFKEIGTVIYLRVPFEVIDERLGNIRQRGVVIREGQTLRDLFAERSVLYEYFADITVDEDTRGIEETLEEILDKLQ